MVKAMNPDGRRPDRPSRARMFAAAALAVLAGCGVLVLLTPPRSAGLLGRSNWALADALPARADFPADWNYSVNGMIGWATPPSPAAESADAPNPIIPTVEYTPARCGELPAALAGAGTESASVRVDTTPVAIAKARFYWRDSVAAGDPQDDGPTADFAILAVGETSDLVGEYLDWLKRCNSYGVSVHYPETQSDVDRLATTMVDEPVEGAALTVTRSFRDLGSGAESLSYQISYYPVRGLLLQCRTNMTGADAELVHRLAVETVRKLRAL